MERAPRPALCRNDYSPLQPPPVGRWEPTLTVSVVIPAHGHQDKLDLVLAALAAQSYPQRLLEVVVVDDASDPPLVLPELRPENTRLIPSDPGGWGSAHTVQTGVTRSDGEVVLRLDADMLTYHDHVESQMRWHHLADYVVAMGHKLFVDHTPGALDPKDVHGAVQRGEAASLFDRETADQHWVQPIIERSDNLRAIDHLGYRVFIGATGSLRRALFEEAGGMDTRLVLGGDTEFAYRVSQCGAVFVPDLDSSSWHLGRSQMQARRDEGKRYRTPFVANRVPNFGPRRRWHGRQWDVPYVDVVVDTADATLEQVAGAVEPLLAGPVQDIRVTLVGEFPPDDGARHGTLDAPDVQARLIAETFRADSRVRLRARVPEPDLAVPFRLLLPPTAQPTREAVKVATKLADKERLGLLEVTLPDGGAVARLERRAAFARARHLDPDGADLDDLVGRVHGARRVDGAEAGLVQPADAGPTPIKDWHFQLTKAQAEAERERERADRLQEQLRHSPLWHLKRARWRLRRRLRGRTGDT